MDRERGGALLEELARRVGAGALLWRGADLSGSDIDVVVLPGSEAALAATLRDHGLTPAPGDPSHVVWRPRDGGDLEVDVLPWAAWPAYYPPLRRVVERARPAAGAPPVAAPEDRLLMLGAEALTGRPTEKTVRRARALLDEPGVREALRDVAAAEGLEAFAELAGAPERLLALERRGRLPYSAALRVALASPPARSALRARVAARLGGDARRHRGILITVSGMDGSGKSTVVAAIEAELAAAGRPVVTAWGRFGGDTAVMDRVAAVARRLLRRAGTIADPVAAGSRLPGRDHEPASQTREGLVAWFWVLFVATLSARRLRRAPRGRRAGMSVVCDRWVADAVVDMELRYGRHRVAELVMSLAAPRADLGIVLLVDSETAFERKSEDQAPWVLAEMERRYSEAVDRWRLTPVDASRGSEEVVREARALVAALAVSDVQRTTRPAGTGR